MQHKVTCRYSPRWQCRFVGAVDPDWNALTIAIFPVIYVLHFSDVTIPKMFTFFFLSSYYRKMYVSHYLVHICFLKLPFFMLIDKLTSKYPFDVNLSKSAQLNSKKKCRVIREKCLT